MCSVNASHFKSLLQTFCPFGVWSLEINDARCGKYGPLFFLNQSSFTELAVLVVIVEKHSMSATAHCNKGADIASTVICFGSDFKKKYDFLKKTTTIFSFWITGISRIHSDKVMYLFVNVWDYGETKLTIY